MEEAAAFLKTSRSSLYRHIDEGKVSGWVPLGGRDSVLAHAVDQVGGGRGGTVPP
ncbi:MAG: helix-turn-helix transcriptional regulator [Nannocystaceae bacterium]